MSELSLGLVLPMNEEPESGEKPPWSRIESMSKMAEAVGFDTVWVPDELLWRVPSWGGPRGFWECVAMAGAVAATTSKIQVGTWVMSALHRNPGLSVKAVETLDEISGGRFVFGFGAGHAGGQGETFGYPPDATVSRYEEALGIVVPILRGEIVSFDGAYHLSAELEVRPRGPRGGRIPLMLGGHGPRTMRLAATHADIWSGYATETSSPEWFVLMLSQLDEACDSVGREPTSLKKSIGVWIEPGTGDGVAAAGLGVPISGGSDQIADALGRFGEMGVDRVEILLWPGNEESLAAMEPVIAQLGR